MIKFTEGGLIDIWPEKDPEIQALSYALQQQFKKLKAYADKTQCYSDVDDLDEEILDYFAVEMRSMYYEQDLEIERKREIVKNTLKWYTYAGVPATVAEMVSVVFGAGKTRGVVQLRRTTVHAWNLRYHHIRKADTGHYRTVECNDSKGQERPLSYSESYHRSRCALSNAPGRLPDSRTGVYRSEYHQRG